MPQIKKVKVLTGKISCFQANNQKRIESCEKLAYYCDNKESFLVLGQEPSTLGMAITGLNRHHTIVSALVEKAEGISLYAQTHC